ncbi:hypothetical protein [Polymorphospora rubra]|uniref:hypothetical protein n=1 Tax=Polymorphospora rubra TaxID=338584 RepID=UPI001FEC2C90|nr:hypothetical protein [Polymorphospora rubra]
MSLVLVPLAVAAVAAAQGIQDRKDAAGRPICAVQTRMRDETLLAEALRDTGATVTGQAGTLTASWDGVTATFGRDADSLVAHFAGAVDEAGAVRLVTSVDQAYGRQVQRTVLARLRAQAPQAGLRLESEQTTADAGVRLVFALEREAAR